VWARSRPTRSPRALRSQIVLRAADGAEDRAIAGELHLHRMTVARWRRRFLAGRLAGLSDEIRLTGRGRVPASTWRSIVREAVTTAAPNGRPWSMRSLARRAGVSHATVHRILRAHGIRPTRFAPVPLRADPVPRRPAWDVVGLFLRPPHAALALTLRPDRRPVTGGSPAGPTSRGDPREPTGPIVREGPPFPVDLPVATRTARQASDRALHRFVARLGRRVAPEAGLRLWITTPHEGADGSWQEWRVRHPRAEWLRLPDFESWRRRSIRELGALGQRMGPGRYRPGRAEVARSLRQSLAAYSPEAGPYEWVAPAPEISDGEAAHRLRYDLAVTDHLAFKSTGPDRSDMTTAPPRAEKARDLARVLLRKYIQLKRGDRLTIETWNSALPEANACVLEALRIGARPLLLFQDEPTYWAAAADVPARNLAALGEHRRAALARTDVFVSFFGPSDRERFHALPRATMFRLSEYQDAMFDAAAKAGARAVHMAIGRVSGPSARMYGVAEETWRSELLAAHLVDPAVLRRRGRAVAERLRRGRSVELTHPNGTHLELRLAGRKPHVSDGTIPKAASKGDWHLVSLPAGVVTVAVDERAGDGTFVSNLPSSIGLSDSVGEMAGAHWTFEAGRLTRFRYDEGMEYFQESYDRAPAGKDRIASLAIGLNDRLHRAPLLEDQGLGTVTVSLGRNDHLGGRTKTPWWAWAFLTEGELLVDGKPLLKRGKLAV
jgi:leucyl aminopeptidase (aminopeptidase T)/transposase